MMQEIVIDSNLEGPKVLIIAGVHGDEYEPMLAANELAKTLPGLIKKGIVTVVPIVNTSAASLDQRLGEDGLDLARICPGKIDGSASEQSAYRVSELIRKTDMLIDLHTGGKLFNIFPLAGYLLHPDTIILNKQQAMAEAFNLPVIWGTESSPNGRTLSVARDENIPAIYVEYGGGSKVRAEIISEYINGCINVLESAGMVDADPNKSFRKLQYWVEDYTPNKGHLQVKMPAPIGGIFIPAINVGDTVEEGQLWGEIINVSESIKKAVYAEENGLVLFLRESAHVKKGGSLGGIIPIDVSSKLVIHGK
jgi:predicted deacylase